MPSLLREGVGSVDGRVVNVQTYGLHRRSMNAPTDLFYKYICLWPKFDVNRLFDNPSDG